MRELTLTELNNVGGGAVDALSGGLLLGAGSAGLAVGIPTIVGGAIWGIPTLGLGFIGMTSGIVVTALSGAMMILGTVKLALGHKVTTPPEETPELVPVIAI
ncbi:hypothetical protein [Erwinia tasmaniensis]|uniref:hypothetical protein n=1 Tax=Erwinia tasmaniensis TaxID=338565 RepID=UPI003A4D23DD